METTFFLILYEYDMVNNLSCVWLLYKKKIKLICLTRGGKLDKFKINKFIKIFIGKQHVVLYIWL